jgi:formate--tetrahydrofolate ligase
MTDTLKMELKQTDRGELLPIRMLPAFRGGKLTPWGGEKLRTVTQRVYGGKDISVLPAAAKQLKRLEELGYGACPVCIAKTQYSFSDDPPKLGAPEDFTVTVKNVKVSAGAGFIVVLTGDIMTMPGLPKAPAAEKIDVDENGRISGLF